MSEGAGGAAGEARPAIRILPPHVAARIAAGEVVERPASIVKELVENAIDAGATRIEIAIAGGGCERVRVRDDGCGIPAAQLADALERHATSKLRSEHELFAIGTLGFRGEALAAIAAAGDVEIVTRPAGEAAAAMVRTRGGAIATLGSAGAAPGTSVEVRELFAALPARRRFLRAGAAEARAVAEAVEAYALAYPAIAFRLESDGRLALQTDGGGSARGAFAAVHGAGIAAALLVASAARVAGDARCTVEGLVGPPALHRATRRGLHLFANGRAIRSPSLGHAVASAYAGLLPIGRHPLGLIDVRVPAEQVDVNVHPTKAEVRFHDERLVYATIAEAVRTALAGAGAVSGPAPSAFAGAPAFGSGLLGAAAAPVEGGFSGSGERPQGGPAFVGAGPLEAPGWAARRAVLAGATAALPVGAVEAGQTALPLATRLPALRPVGQLAATYLLAEAPDGLVLVDQHAAHERVLYERVRAERAAGTVVRQPLLAAAFAPLSAVQSALALEHAEAIAALGFELAASDGAGVFVRAVPALLVRRDPGAALVEYLERLGAAEERLAGPDRAAAALACRAAVMAGDRLDVEQQRALLRELEACAEPHTCPHGRPTLVHVSGDAIARSFLRR